MSGWTAILLAALVAARAPKGTFTGSGDDASAPTPARPTAVAETKAPPAAGEPAATSTVAAASESTGTVAGVAAPRDEGKTAPGMKKVKAPTAEEKALEEEKARHGRLVAFWKKTPHYFIGTYGILAVIGMALAMYWLVRYARRRERSVYYFRALLVTLAALVLTDWTYFDIAERIEVDRVAQEVAGRAWQEEVKAKAEREAKEAKTVGERVEMMRFAEESDADRKQLKEAGQKGESQKDELDKALESVQTPPPEDNEPEYKKKGRQKRTASTNKTDVVDAGAAKGEVKQEKPWRVMLENDMFRATMFGRILLFLSQLACWLALGSFVLDYLSRFNLTFDYFFPLPLSLIGGDRFIEMLLLRSKPLTTLCKGVPRDRLVPYLDDLIRKGETFVYFGERDPTPDQDRFHRFSFGRLHLLPVRKFVCSSQKPWDGPEFVLESCWFGRGCFVVEGLSVAERLREEMQEFLLLRQRSRAWAQRTVHFVWDHPLPPAQAFLDDMLACGRNTNLKVVVFSPAFAGAETGETFQESYAEFPTPRPSPVLLERLIRGGVADTVSWMLARSWTMLVDALRAAWPWILRTPGYLGRAGAALWALIRVVALGIGRCFRWAWPALRGIAKVLWIVIRFVGRAAWVVCRGTVTVLSRGSKGAGGMFGAWSKERKAKKAEEKAKRDAEWKRLMEARKLAEEKAMQATAAKVAAAKEAAQKAAAEKAALPGAGSLVKKQEPATPPAQGKAALAERIKAKQAERVGSAGGKKVDLAQILKAKQAAAQAKAAGTLLQGGEANAAAGSAVAPATPSASAKDAAVPPSAQAATQPSAQATAAPVAPQVQAKPDEALEKQAKDKAAIDARIRAEVEERLRKEREERERQAKEKTEQESRERAEKEARAKAETEERLRREREEAQRQAKAKAEEDARKAREQAEAVKAAEAARLKSEEVDQQAKEDAEREARERAEAEARAKAEVEERLRMEREEAERQAKEKAEEDARKAREQAETEERLRKEREEVERQAREKAEREVRERVEMEARVRAEVEERLRKESEEAERQAKAKAEEDARKAREQAEAEERARKAREEIERQIREKTEREMRERIETEARIRAEVEEKLRKERQEAERLAQQKSAAVQQPSSQSAVQTATPPAGAAKPDAPAGGKRIVIVKRPGQGPAKPVNVAAAPKPQEQPQVAPTAPKPDEGGPVAQPPPAASVPPPVRPEPPGSPAKPPPPAAVAPEPAETEQEEVPVETGEGEESPGVRPGTAPESKPPKEAKRIVVVKKQAGGVSKPPAAEPRPVMPSAPPPRVPVMPPEPAPEQATDEIRFHCPHCGQHLAAPSQLMGRQFPCTQCRRPIIVPMPAGEEAPDAVPPSAATIMAAPMPPPVAPQVRVSFVPPKQTTRPSGQLRPPVFGAPPQPPHPQEPQQTDGQFKFFCPLCGQKLSAKREWVGRSLKCPACQKAVVIPSPT